MKKDGVLYLETDFSELKTAHRNVVFYLPYLDTQLYNRFCMKKDGGIFQLKTAHRNVDFIFPKYFSRIFNELTFDKREALYFSFIMGCGNEP